MTAIAETRSRSVAAIVSGDWEDVRVVETRTASFAFPTGWRPPVNAYRCDHRFVIFVDVAGVPFDSISVHTDVHRVTVRGERPPPEPGFGEAATTQLLALEIDQGGFERSLDLPQAVEPTGLVTDYRDGLLRIELPIRE